MNKIKYSEWTSILWDGNSQMAADGTIFDCWRKSFPYGHVSIFKCVNQPDYVNIVYSFGASSDFSMSGCKKTTDTEKVKAFVDIYVGEGFHFKNKISEKSKEIWDKLNINND